MSLSLIPTNTTNTVIQATDVNQCVNVLQQPSGGQEIGHYILAGNGYATSSFVCFYVPSLSRGSVPVSVTLDASDISNSGYSSSPANNAHLTANGFEVWDTTSAATGNAVIGGKYTLQY